MTTFTVTNLNDSGSGSLRAAISAANAAPGSTIDFAVGGTITLASDLPAVTSGVTIDATTAPGHVSGGAPVVELDCNGHAGLVFGSGADGSQLLGLAVAGASGNGVTLDAGSVTLAGNYIGLNLSGQAAGNAGAGVYVASTSSKDLIGLNPTAASNVVSNVISGNGGNGIEFVGSSSNTLVNNYIGTDPTGQFAIANGGNGIRMTAGSSGNEIGGTAFTDSNTGAQNDPTGDKGMKTPVIVVPPLGNLVSGNGQNGILIDSNSRNNILNGNFVGTTADGNHPLGNALDGVAIRNADNNSLIGCNFEQSPFAYYNVVSGNGRNGLQVTDSNGTVIQANFFGIGANNATVVSNALNGVLVDGTSANTLMGGPIPLGNVASGNGQNGIEVKGTASGFTSYNSFGGLFAFGGAAPNGNDGILVTATGGNQTIQTDVFSGNRNNGIEIAGNASGVTVDPNIAGLYTNGSSVLANGGNGLEISGTAHGNIIGGHKLSLLPENVFSGNDGYGIAIEGAAYDNQVINTFVGFGRGGGALPNQLGGILVAGTAHNNTIGDVASQPDRTNEVIVSGNDGNGITLGNHTSFTSILNNIIGATKTGKPLPNTGVPIDTGASTNNTIEGNLIVACFTAGTRIALPDSEIAVERLRVGDLVRTLSGRAAPIVWIGHRRIDCRRHAAPGKVQPIRIAAHSFGRNLPGRDLLLSPDHAIYADGVLIPIRHLVNGTTIVQTRVKAVRYFHIELDRHDVVMAEGLPAESYLDTADRLSFANTGDIITLHPEWGRRDVMPRFEAFGYAPLRVAGPEIAAVRRRLAGRARRLEPDRITLAHQPACAL